MDGDEQVGGVVGGSPAPATAIVAAEGGFAPGAEVTDIILYIRTPPRTVLDRIFDHTGDLINFRYMEGDAPAVAPNLPIRRVLVPREVDISNLYIVDPFDAVIEITTRAEFDALSATQRQQGATVAVRQETKRKKPNEPMKEPTNSDGVSDNQRSNVDGGEQMKRKRAKKTSKPKAQPATSTGGDRQHRNKRKANDPRQTPAQQGDSVQPQVGDDPPDDLILPHFQILLDIESFTEERSREELQQMLKDADSKTDVDRIVWTKCGKRTPRCPKFGKWHYALKQGQKSNNARLPHFIHLSTYVKIARVTPATSTGGERRRRKNRKLNEPQQTPAQQGDSVQPQVGDDPPDDFIPPHFQVLLDIDKFTEQRTTDQLRQLLRDADSEIEIDRIKWRKCRKQAPRCPRFGKWHYVLRVGHNYMHLDTYSKLSQNYVKSGRQKISQKKYDSKPGVRTKAATKKRIKYANNQDVREKKLKYRKDMSKNVFYLSVSIKEDVIDGKTAKQVWQMLQDPESTSKMKPQWYFGKNLQRELEIAIRRDHPNKKNSAIRQSYIEYCRIFECLANVKEDDDEASIVESYYIHHSFALEDTDPNYIALNTNYGKRIHSDLIKKALANGKTKIPFVKFTNDEANTNDQYEPPFVIRLTDFQERTEWFKDVPRTRSTTPGVKPNEELENETDSEHVFYLAVCIEESIIEGKTEEEVWEMFRSQPSSKMKPRWYFGFHSEIGDGEPTMRRSHVGWKKSPIRKSYIEKCRVFECIASVKKDKNEASTVESFFIRLLFATTDKDPTQIALNTQFGMRISNTLVEKAYSTADNGIHFIKFTNDEHSPRDHFSAPLICRLANFKERTDWFKDIPRNN